MSSKSNKETAESESKINLGSRLIKFTCPLLELKGDYSTSDSEIADETVSIRNTANAATSNNLDDDLYGSSDGFNNTLEHLKKKLLSLKVSESTCSSDGSMDNCSTVEDRYLSTREGCVNISSPFESRRFTERFKDYSYIKRLDSFRSAISTIYEAQEFSESSTASSGSYRVPEKKLCLRETKYLDKSSQVTLESPESDNLSQIQLNLPKEVSSESSLYSTKKSNKQTCRFSPIDAHFLKPIDEIKLHLPLDITSKSSNEFTSDSSDQASLYYQTPIKKRCTRTKSPIITLNSIQEENTADIRKNTGITVLKQTAPKPVKNNIRPDIGIKTLNEAGDFSSKTVTQISNKIDTFSYSLTSSDKCPSTNLPSSIIDEDNANNEVFVKTTVRTIERKTKKAFKRTRSNKVNDINSARLSFTTDYSSGDYYYDEDASSKKLALLYKKYYADSSDLSINEISTPPAIISTNTSSSGKHSSTLSKNSKQSNHSVCRNEILNRSNSQRFDLLNRNDKLELEKVSSMLEPVFCSSLDVPRLPLHTYIFPAVTKLITFPEILQNHFILDSNDFIDNKMGSRLCHKNSDCFSNEGFLSLLNDDSDQNMCSSAEQNDERLNNVQNKNSSKSRGIGEIIEVRKKQSTDLSYYSIASDTVLNEVHYNQESNSGYKNVLEACINCCCLKAFFSKTKT